ncbi:Aste57867_19895 [Aphanomyces stellatus]|uniref:Aste57867_19895 protein n=1 Tax=Aphanomyces stellatus TaxID=120398 RepID=A0A485LIB5_9STRA|nr:hypothetical protein As57867_019829 [Aphanomyces stellatus]VFT96593.1 Aste57867_19895 [Aphanomyces stellatus]
MFASHDRRRRRSACDGNHDVKCWTQVAAAARRRSERERAQQKYFGWTKSAEGKASSLQPRSPDDAAAISCAMTTVTATACARHAHAIESTTKSLAGGDSVGGPQQLLDWWTMWDEAVLALYMDDAMILLDEDDDAPVFLLDESTDMAYFAQEFQPWDLAHCALTWS